PKIVHHDAADEVGVLAWDPVVAPPEDLARVAVGAGLEVLAPALAAMATLTHLLGQELRVHGGRHDGLRGLVATDAGASGAIPVARLAAAVLIALSIRQVPPIQSAKRRVEECPRRGLARR